MSSLLLLFAVAALGLLVSQSKPVPAATANKPMPALDLVTEVLGGVRWFLPAVASTALADLKLCRVVQLTPAPASIPSAKAFEVQRNLSPGVVSSARELVDALVAEGLTVIGCSRMAIPGMVGAVIAAVTADLVKDYAAPGTGWSVLAAPGARSVGWAPARRPWRVG